MTSIQINTSRGPKTPEAALALLIDPASDQGTMRGVLKELRDKAPGVAIDAARYILDHRHSFPDKVKKIADEIINCIPNRAKAMRIKDAAEVYNFFEKLQRGERVRITFRQGEAWVARRLTFVQDLLKPDESIETALIAVRLSGYWGNDRNRTIPFTILGHDPTRIADLIGRFVERIEIIQN